MRIGIFILLFFPLLAIGQKKECDCGRYLTGSFYTLGPEGSEQDTLFITRTVNTQTEIVGTDYNKKNKVIWLSSCKFILRDSDNLNMSSKPVSTDVIVQIIETYDDRYVVRAWAPHQKKMTMTIYVKK
jgi:hypothetical protein